MQRLQRCTNHLQMHLFEPIDWLLLLKWAWLFNSEFGDPGGWFEYWVFEYWVARIDWFVYFLMLGWFKLQPTPPAHHSSLFSPMAPTGYNIPPTPVAPGSIGNMGSTNLFSAPPAHTGSVSALNLASTSLGSAIPPPTPAVAPMTPLNPATPASESSGIVPQLQ